MAQLYTPFMTEAGRSLGGALAQRGQSKLMGDAYMGDPQAMQDLMRVNPEAGMKLQQQKQQEEQLKLQRSAQKEQQSRKLFSENKEIIDQVVKDVAAFESFPEAQAYFERKKEEYRPIFGDSLDNVPLTEQMWQESKTVQAQGPAADFAGKGMEAQVSNMMTRGVEDPSFRSTPEYAIAYQKMTEPKIVRTPTGDILHYPKVSDMFKPPGDVVPDKEQVSIIQEAVKKDVEVIPGTEKELKTTADEKLSYGFYDRMDKAEASIKRLGDYDSSDVWERLKGVTNVTASKELQQYRQAADDWIRSKLRRESGAVIADEEMSKEYKIYFPQIGDSQEVIDQKKAARATARSAMKTASGIEFKKQKKAAAGELNTRADQLRQELGL